jgi:hypothetical protein
MALVAVVLSAFAGASVAAVTATGQPGHHTTTAPRVAPDPVPTASAPVQAIPGAKLVAAAEYLGVSMTELTAELQEGKTLAQIADETPGRSADGLIKVLIEKRRAQLDQALASLPKRVTQSVRKKGAPTANGTGMREAALAYLGISAGQLAHDLRAGQTLGDIAEATAGHSREGLAKALYAARQRQLENAVKAGRLSDAARHVRLSHVQRRVNRVLARTKRHGRHHAGSH